MVRVETTEQLRDAVLAAAADADAVVMAAAPADFRPATVSGTKIKKAADGSAPALELRAEPRHPRRALAPTGPRPGRWSSASPPRPATTTGSVLDPARAKLARKGCDLLVVNDVSGGAVFGSADNEAVILDADGRRGRRAARLEGGAGPRDLGPGRRRGSTTALT